jgi:hypothetical protein
MGVTFWEISAGYSERRRPTKKRAEADYLLRALEEFLKGVWEPAWSGSH